MSLRVNCQVIFGDNLGEFEHRESFSLVEFDVLANNREFVEVAQRYHRQAVVAMLTAHYLPNWTDE